MSTNLIQRLTPIFHDVFNPDVVVSAELDASQVDEWDSLNHIALIVALEGEFGIEFTTDELEQMVNVGELMKVLEARGAV